MMNRDVEFSTLVRNSAAMTIVPSMLQFRRRRFALFPGLLEGAALGEIVTTLDQEMFPLLRRVSAPIPRSTITAMKRNYSEQLPKALRIRTADLNVRRSRALSLARKLGLTALMRSESLARFAEAVSGFTLARPCEAQIICYCHGDYAGPHNDHHPEDRAFRNGYLDLQITLVNQGVDQQYLVYERRGHLSEVADVSQSGSVAVYYLPFWHYTTPLVAKASNEADAKRWLLLSTFRIVR